MTEAAARNEETQKSQVDTETTERFIAEKHIGERIKRLRLKKSMGLVELGSIPVSRQVFFRNLKRDELCRRCATWRVSRWSSRKTSPTFSRRNRNRCFACIAAKTVYACRRPA